MATGSASKVLSTSATLSGSVNPNGRSTSYWFEYGTTTNYGSRTSSRSAGSGASSVGVARDITGLAPGTVYHFRVVAQNSVATTRGADRIFTTVTTAGVGVPQIVEIRPTSARLVVGVDTRGQTTTVVLEYGPRGDLSSRTGAVSLSGTAREAAFELAGLPQGRRTYVRAVATSSLGHDRRRHRVRSPHPPSPRVPAGQRIRCTIVGTQGPDRLRGTIGRDVICGLGGNDRMDGLDGRDVLIGGPGEDVLVGSDGDDLLVGGAGRDELVGGVGTDRLEAGEGADRLVGGPGGDTLSGGSLGDILLGGAGRDVLLGGSGNDVLLARDGGRDVVDGGPGAEHGARRSRTRSRLSRTALVARQPPPASSIRSMAVAAETLAQLRAGGLADVDPEIATLLGREAERQRGTIELIASENFTWPSILEAVGSVPTNKYAEGYPGRRYYGGCEVVDEIEQLAIDRAKALFGAEHANVQPHAGAQANMGAYFGLLEPGDTILGLRLDHGGHLTHGLKVNFSGRLYTIASYGVSRETSLVEEAEVLALARQHRPKLIVCGGSAYPRTVDTAMFRRVADEVGALLMCDMAHFSGLVAAGLHPNPVEHCDVVTSTTHKTLAGPRSGFILCRAEHAQAIDRAVFPGMQGGPLQHAIAAKATCFRIAALGALPRLPATGTGRTPTRSPRSSIAGGLDVLTGGTDTHLLQLDLRRTEWTGKDAEERLHEVGLTVNRNTVPYDERPPTVASGVRLGTPAVTMRGFDEDDAREIGRIIVGALADDADSDALAARSAALCERRPLYPGFRGYSTYLTD